MDIRDKAIAVVVEVLLTNPSTLIADITKNHREVLLAFTANNARSQKYLLGALESLVQRYKDALLDPKRIPNLLNAFYNADLLSEAALIEWDDKGPTKRHTGDRKLSKQIHELAQPFINWLKTADVEESSEEEEQPPKKAAAASAAAANAEPKPKQQVSANGKPVAKDSVKVQQKVEEDNDSDVDIDNI